uniref:hypothetical protein n=1 Tax=[Lactobacillus] rogosae TaxID=706562 RepID=UPI00402AFD50
MTRKNLLKATLITTIIATILTTTACGKKTASSNTADNTKPQATVSAETKSNAAKELTKTSLVTFDYTDEAGNTYTLEGKAVANESGAATIEVSDNSGNKVIFTGKAATADGKMTVSGITVKDAGTLIKPDGTEIKVTTGTIVADAAKSDETTESDIAASEDAKQEVETSKKEEAVIEEVKEAVTKAEEIADNTTDNNGGNSDDTIIADNGSNESSDNQGNDERSDNNDNAGNTDSNPSSSDNNNSDNNVTPASPTPDETEDKKDETPAPAPVEPTPNNSKDNSDNGNNGGYDFSTVEGPNGPMYGADYEDRKMRGQDVNQGADKPCPYELKTVTTRYFFSQGSYSNRQGYYYVAIDEYGGECEDDFNDLAYQMGKYNYTSKRVGMYSCGMVWFTAFDD